MTAPWTTLARAPVSSCLYIPMPLAQLLAKKGKTRRRRERPRRGRPERDGGRRDMKLFASEWNVVWFKVLPVI